MPALAEHGAEELDLREVGDEQRRPRRGDVAGHALRRSGSRARARASSPSPTLARTCSMPSSRRAGSPRCRPRAPRRCARAARRAGPAARGARAPPPRRARASAASPRPPPPLRAPRARAEAAAPLVLDALAAQELAELARRVASSDATSSVVDARAAARENSFDHARRLRPRRRTRWTDRGGTAATVASIRPAGDAGGVGASPAASLPGRDHVIRGIGSTPGARRPSRGPADALETPDGFVAVSAALRMLVTACWSSAQLLRTAPVCRLLDDRADADALAVGPDHRVVARPPVAEPVGAAGVPAVISRPITGCRSRARRARAPRARRRAAARPRGTSGRRGPRRFAR